MPLPQKRDRGTFSEQSWFETLFGFEESADGRAERMTEIRKQFAYDADTGQLKSLANDAVFAAGKFRMASVAELRAEAMRKVKDKRGEDADFLLSQKQMRVAYGDVANLMADKEFYGAMFQVSVLRNAMRLFCLNFTVSLIGRRPLKFIYARLTQYRRVGMAGGVAGEFPRIGRSQLFRCRWHQGLLRRSHSGPSKQHCRRPGHNCAQLPLGHTDAGAAAPRSG